MSSQHASPPNGQNWPNSAKVWYNICWESKKRGYRKSWTTFLNSIQSINNIIVASSFIGVSLSGASNPTAAFVDLAVFFGSLAFIFAILSSVIVAGSLRLVDDIFDDYCRLEKLWIYVSRGVAISGPSDTVEQQHWDIPDIARLSAKGNEPDPETVTDADLHRESAQLDRVLLKKRKNHSRMYRVSLAFTGIALTLLCATLIFLAQAKIGVILSLATVLTVVLAVLGAVLMVIVFLHEEITDDLPGYHLRDFD